MVTIQGMSDMAISSMASIATPGMASVKRAHDRIKNRSLMVSWVRTVEHGLCLSVIRGGEWFLYLTVKEAEKFHRDRVHPQCLTKGGVVFFLSKVEASGVREVIERKPGPNDSTGRTVEIKN
jgi:hypothetical protein